MDQQKAETLDVVEYSESPGFMELGEVVKDTKGSMWGVRWDGGGWKQFD